MGFTSYKKDKLLMEGWRKFLKKNLLAEEISNFEPDQFPNPLSGEASKSYMVKGWDDSPSDKKVDDSKEDDKVSSDDSATVPASSLMPSQNAWFPNYLKADSLVG